MIKPMLATLVDAPFDRAGWLFEIKWDGFRAIAEIKNGKISLYSRYQKSFNTRFAEVVKALKTIKRDAVLDGEIVVFDPKGRSKFELLQNYLHDGTGTLVYCVFDLLSLDGKSLVKKPLIERKTVLKKILPKNRLIRFSEHVQSNGVAYFRAAKKEGLEGIMMKDGLSPYLPGERTRYWQKAKIRQSLTAVICGWTEPAGARQGIGALVLCRLERNKWIYMGNVGTGFDSRNVKDILKALKPLKIIRSPLSVQPKLHAEVHWVKPQAKAVVSYEEWTSDRKLRQPSFKKLINENEK